MTLEIDVTFEVDISENTSEAKVEEMFGEYLKHMLEIPQHDGHSFDIIDVTVGTTGWE
jgi:hypothetical protein